MDYLLTIIDDMLNNEFDSLKSCSQRIGYAFDKIDSIEDLRLNMHKFISENKTKNRKSLSKSQEYRQKGYGYYIKKNFEYALYYYNLAVMTAPYPSDSSQELDDELSFAYTSRSLTFFEMECYENSLFDINCALLMSSSMKFPIRLELMMQKVNCLYYLGRNEDSKELISKIIQLIPCLPKYNETVEDLIQMSKSLSYKTNEEIEESETQKDLNLIADYCENIDQYINIDCQLSATELKGRYMKAGNYIPNKSIVMIDKSYSAVLFESLFQTHCQNCFRNIGYKYWPCQRCNQVVFCNQECAEEAYYHYYECGIVNLIQGLGVNHHIVFRILLLIGPQNPIKLAKQISADSENINDLDENMKEYVKFIQLIDHSESHDLQTKVLCTYRSIQLAFIFDYFREFKFDNKDLMRNMKELAVILESNNYKVSTNAFGMFEQKTKSRSFRGRHIGNAICLKPSFFNHSCDPNIFWQFNNKHITLITTRDVKSGEELSISYGPYHEMMPFEERQNLLKTRYYFRCNCSACISDAKQLPTLKCYNCGEGLIIYDNDSIESSCILCNKEYDISFIIKKVQQIDKSFNHWINEFEKQTDSELLLIKAEKCYNDFSKFLYGKSRRMFEINFKLSRSFQLFGNYFKAMFYSRKVLEFFFEFESDRFDIEMVFFSRVYFQHLYRERASFIKDKEWNHCFEVISETILILKKCIQKLMTIFCDELSEPNLLKSAEKRIQVIKKSLNAKEKQIIFILGLDYY